MSSHTNAAFYYVAEGYTTGGKTLMGRQSAGEGFLKGFVKHSGVDNFYCYGPDNAQFNYFRNSVSQTAGSERPCTFIPFENFQQLGNVGCLFVPGPDINRSAWVRRSFNSKAYSICGVTHTTATEKIMDSIGDLLIDPVQSWDAVICTSTVVKKTLERVLDAYGEYLKDRCGARPEMPVQLPIIPLGVDCSQFQSVNNTNCRLYWRDKLGVTEDDIVVLYVGRLSFSAKSHPLPMFLALEEAARRTKKKVHLIMAGWFDPPAAEHLWRKDVQRYCPSVKAIFMDGRVTDIKREIWSAADIFTSLSDNIQETFGLTPIEAMAAGLPVVVTDWDGYRDTVRHGIDGFRVPTLMPESGTGQDLAIRFANGVDGYGKYCGIVSQMTSADVGACAAAYAKLMQDKAMRNKMGEAGKQRAREVFDWAKVVQKYQELWGELAERRNRDVETAPLNNEKPPMPLRMDPFALFQEYPTDRITCDSKISLQAGKFKNWLNFIASSAMNGFAVKDSKLLLSIVEQTTILEYLKANNYAKVSDIEALFEKDKTVVVKRTIGWMGKNGVIAIKAAIKGSE